MDVTVAVVAAVLAVSDAGVVAANAAVVAATAFALNVSILGVAIANPAVVAAVLAVAVAACCMYQMQVLIFLMKLSAVAVVLAVAVAAFAVAAAGALKPQVKATVWLPNKLKQRGANSQAYDSYLWSSLSGSVALFSVGDSHLSSSFSLPLRCAVG